VLVAPANVISMMLILNVLAGTGSSSSRVRATGAANSGFRTLPGIVGVLSGIFPGRILNPLPPDQHIPWQMRRLTSTQAAPSPMSILMKMLRWILAPAAALVITMGLLFMMQTMIETGESVIQKMAAVEFADFIRVRRDERIETRTEKPKKMMPEELPEMLDPRQAVEQDPGGITIGYSMTKLAHDQVDLAGLIGDFGSADGEFMPLVRVLPIYPQRARQRGLEGWVTLEFTITASGAVQNVRVLESSNSVFERPAVRAVQKFKYRPRIHNGQPVAVTGVWYKITFKMED